MRRTRSSGKSSSPSLSSSLPHEKTRTQPARSDSKPKLHIGKKCYSTTDCKDSRLPLQLECALIPVECDGYTQITPLSDTDNRTPMGDHLSSHDCSSVARIPKVAPEKMQEQRQTHYADDTDRHVGCMETDNSMWRRSDILHHKHMFTSSNVSQDRNFHRVLRSYYKKLFTDSGSSPQTPTSDVVLKSDSTSESQAYRCVLRKDSKHRKQNTSATDVQVPSISTGRQLRSDVKKRLLLTNTHQIQDADRVAKSRGKALERKVVADNAVPSQVCDRRMRSSRHVQVQKMKRSFADISARIHDRVLRSYKCKQSNDVFFKSLMSTSSDSDLVVARSRRRVVFQEPEVTSFPEVIGKLARHQVCDSADLSDDELLEEMEDGQNAESRKGVVVRWDTLTVVVLGVVVGMRLLYETWSHNFELFPGLGLLGVFGNKSTIA